MRPAAALVLVAVAAACAGPRSDVGEPAPPSPLAHPLEHVAVRPTLEEVFLRPPISGDPPELVSVSADGRFALVRWSPPGPPGSADAAPPSEAGEEEDGDDDAPRRAELRLLDAEGPPEGPAGVPLAALLPAPEGDGPAPRLVAAWSAAGARLAVGRGSRVYLVDPAAREARPVLAWQIVGDEDGEGEGDAPDEQDEAEDEAEAEDEGEAEAEDEGEAEDDDDGEDQGEGDEEPEAHDAADRPAPPPPVLALREVRTLAFADDDARLVVGDGIELVELVPPDAGAPPRSLADVAWPTRRVEADVDELQLDRARAVAFGHDPVPRPDAAPDAQVWRIGEERGVALEGMAEVEELDGASLSPDGRFVFAMEVDRSAEPDPALVPDFLTPRVSVREARRRLADDPPAPRRLWMWDATSGAREELALPLDGAETAAGDRPAEPSDEAPHVRVVGWAPQPEPGTPARLALERVSADARTLELWCWSEGALRRLHVEHDPGWIGGPARRTRWAADGRTLLLGSEVAPGTTTRGRSQLFALDVDAPERGARQLTAVAGEVTGFRPLEGGGTLVEASEEDPGQRAVLYLPAAAVEGRFTTDAQRYAQPPGWNAGARAAADGSRAWFLHEELLVPAEVVTATRDAWDTRTDTVPDAFRAVDWIRPERIVVRAPDGALVHAHVWLPPGVALEAPGPPRATIVFVHGAGYLQNVTDSMTRYPLNALFHARLARLGYPVVDVDYRGSAGYGGRFRSDVQYHLGGKDLDDVHLVVDELAALGLVDPERVGVYGGSYGGFLALMALFTAPERWAVGAALRSVTDWRTYHPGYTVPRLGRPSTHPDAFERSSPIDHVEGLEDPLLVLHGMVDANVFAQDSIRLVEELILAGKDFEAMLYPSQGHAFHDGRHWLDQYRRIERFLVRHLGPPVLPGAAAGGGWAVGAGAVWVDLDGDGDATPRRAVELRRSAPRTAVGDGAEVRR